MENEKTKKVRPCIKCKYNDGIFCHAWSCPFEELKDKEEKDR